MIILLNSVRIYNMLLRDLVEQQRKNPYIRASVSPSVFNCEHPIRLYNRYINEYVHVPCRKCRCCLSAIAEMKSARLVRDCENYRYNFFVTLTFDKEHLPLAHFVGVQRDDDNNWFAVFQKSSYNCLTRQREFDSILYSHPIDKSNFVAPKNCPFPDCFSIADKQGFQKFIKRLRKRISKLPNYDKQTYKIRYAFVNEFGPRTYRAHLHGILSTDCEELAKCLPLLVRKSWATTYKVSDTKYEECGFCSSRRIEVKRISGADAQKYVCKYICGDYRLPSLLKAKPFRSFFLNSRLPALGLKKTDCEICKVIFDTCNVVQRVYNERTKEFVECLIPDILFSQFFRKCTRYNTSSVSYRVAILEAYRTVEKTATIDYLDLYQRLSVKTDKSDFQTFKVFNEQNKLYYKCFKYWLSVYPNLTPREYVERLDKIYSNRALYLLRSFYEKQEYISQHVDDTAKLIAFYPEAIASLPETCNYRHWLFLDKKYNYSSFGLDFSDLYYIDNFDLLHAYAYPWEILRRSQENEVTYHIYAKSVSALNLDDWSENHSKTIHNFMNNSNKRKKYNDSLHMWDIV